MYNIIVHVGIAHEEFRLRLLAETPALRPRSIVLSQAIRRAAARRLRRPRERTPTTRPLALSCPGFAVGQAVTRSWAARGGRSTARRTACRRRSFRPCLQPR